MFVLSLLVLCLSLASRWRVEATSLALYNDTGCSASSVLENVAALNGYPDGQCTHLTDLNEGDTYNGFKFLTLDDGCAITLYGPDSEVCSGPTFVASLNVCYNTSWTYYSVDGCTVPSISSSIPSSTSTSTVSLSSSTAASAASSSSSGSSSSSSSSGPSLSGGGLAGVIIVGIIAAAAIVVAAIFFFGRRTRRRDQERAAREAAETEMKPPHSGVGVQGEAPRQYGSLGMSPISQQTGVHEPVYEAHGQLPVTEMPSHTPNELPEKPYR